MRLIDADALKEMKFSGGMHDDNWIVYVPLREVVENIDKAPTVGGWISVKDRLPNDCERVLVYMERDAWDRKGKFRRKKDIEKGWQIDGVWHVDGCSRVLGLYWMPLPEPPKEGEV